MPATDARRVKVGLALVAVGVVAIGVVAGLSLRSKPLSSPLVELTEDRQTVLFLSRSECSEWSAAIVEETDEMLVVEARGEYNMCGGCPGTITMKPCVVEELRLDSPLAPDKKLGVLVSDDGYYRSVLASQCTGIQNGFDYCLTVPVLDSQLSG